MRFHHSLADGLEGWTLEDAQAELAPWLGRQALMLRSGFVLAPVEMAPPYALKATVSGGLRECYVGFCFHLADAENYETIYLAPQAGDRPTGIQYDPVINGSNTWQVFGDADGLAAGRLRPPLQSEHWHLLALYVWADIAQVHVDEDPSPKAVFPLRSGLRRGSIGLWGYLPSYVADFEVRPLSLPPPPFPEPKVAVPTGTVREWLVAQYDERSQAFVGPRRARTEHNGTLCLNRLYRAPPRARAMAACDIDVPQRAGQAVLEVGYSDGGRVWWDDALSTRVNGGGTRLGQMAGSNRGRSRFQCPPRRAAIVCGQRSPLRSPHSGGASPPVWSRMAYHVLGDRRPGSLCRKGFDPRSDLPAAKEY